MDVSDVEVIVPPDEEYERQLLDVGREEELDNRIIDEEEEEENKQCSSQYRANAPKKRKRAGVDVAELNKVRRLLIDVPEPATKRTFSLDGEIIDLENPKTCEAQMKLFACIYNSLLVFTKSTFTPKTIIDQAMRLRALTVKKTLHNLTAAGYKKYYMVITRTVLSILRDLEEMRHPDMTRTFVQLCPITCTIDENIRANLGVDKLLVRTVNKATSLSVELNHDLKFVYVGDILKKTINDIGEKYSVSPITFMGNYIDILVSDLYDIIYERTKKSVHKFFREHPNDPNITPIDIFSEIDSRSNYCNPTGAHKQEEDKATLCYLLRTVGREVNLKKSNLDKVDIFVLTSTQKNSAYLYANEETAKMDKTPTENTRGVFLSSYLRVRIMEDGYLKMQIYSKTCMVIGDNDEFPTILSDNA